jgi:hypothetical protein
MNFTYRNNDITKEPTETAITQKTSSKQLCVQVLPWALPCCNLGSWSPASHHGRKVKSCGICGGQRGTVVGFL